MIKPIQWLQVPNRLSTSNIDLIKTLPKKDLDYYNTQLLTACTHKDTLQFVKDTFNEMIEVAKCYLDGIL